MIHNSLLSAASAALSSRADAGLDIGNTLIGMHLKRVAVPVRLSVERIGKAFVVAARTRPKYIGGGRARPSCIPLRTCSLSFGYMAGLTQNKLKNFPLPL